ncbi:hypothetical protein HHK36_027400 [Tetracentron sinense]|uniref:DUF7725 domain-containing protein n=1 Tax=Tetracentron sinense TaxID=13715 RepID=A0A834YJ31_TETSI|nr:hypothetical protein HHK36_027400 [Tetracentron sinense]
MEAAAGVAAGRGGSLPMSIPMPARKEWRAVSEHSIRNAGNEELERSKLGQSEERTIYEVQQGALPLDSDLCSLAMDGSLDIDLLQQRLHSISRQIEELQHMETELRAQVIARVEIVEMQSSFDAQIKEHTNAAARLKDQLQERDQTIHELDLKLEEKDRELHAIKIDNEAAWAKEDLLREQNKELATFRRERDNSEAERTQLLKQVHDLKEHVQEKERQLHDMEEQHRVVQETIIYKDERLREAQAWAAQVQERDALQSTTNHSLQAEFRERTEQFNQFWLGCQRQFSDMERLHLHTIQQLQLKLAEARERSGIYHDESHMDDANSKDASPFGQNQGKQLDLNEGGTLSSNSGILPNGNMDHVPPFVSTGDASTKIDQVSGVPIVPSPLFGMGPYLPPGQVTALHPFVMHQQGVPHSVPSTNSHVPQSHVGHFQPIPAISSHQYWQTQQATSEGLQISNHNQYQPSLIEQNLLRSDAHYDYELSANDQVLRSEYLDAINTGQEPSSVITIPSDQAQVLESNDERYLVVQQPQQNLQENTSQFLDALILDHPEPKNETQGQDENIVTATNISQEVQGLTTEPPESSANTSLFDSPGHPVDISETMDSNASCVILPDVSFSDGRPSNSLTLGNTPEPTLLDERSLLACIVRAIPAGSAGRIRISSTLPNRLGKMLAPLHWHDYKRIYGNLDDFVGCHPELFVIEGDFIQLREGAQEIVSATAAVAKVAAAAAASAPYSTMLPSVAVTPVAQTHRSKKVSSFGSRCAKAVSTEPATGTPADAYNKYSQRSAMPNQHIQSVYNVVQGLSNVKILSKPKDPQELNDIQSKFRPGHSSVHVAVGNGTNPYRTGLGTLQNNGSNNGRHGMNFGGKQQGR